MIFWKYEEYMLEIIIVLALLTFFALVAIHILNLHLGKFPELLDSAKPERKGRNKQNT